MKAKRSQPATPAGPPSILPTPVFGALVFAAGGWTLWRAISIASPFLRDLRHLADLPSALSITFVANALYVCAFWSIAVWLGRTLMNGLGLRANRLEENALGGALGAGILSTLLFFGGLVGLWKAALLRAAFCIAAAASVAAHFRAVANPPSTALPGWKLGAFEKAASVFIVISLTAAALTTMAPETFYDSLTFHLALPKLYLMTGRIIPTPHVVFSGTPMSAHMLYGLMLSIGDGRLTSLLHLSCGVITALLMTASAVSLGNPPAGVLAALLFLVCPMVLYSGTMSGVDLFSSLYVAAGFHAMLRGLEPTQERRLCWAAAAGITVGAAMATKYNVFAVGAVLMFWYAVISLRRGQGMTAPLVSSVAALTMLLPWMLRNLAWFNNPLFPFGSKTPPIPDWAGFLSSAAKQDLGAAFTTWPGFKAFVSIPYCLSLTGELAMDNWPGMALFLLIPWSLVRGKPGVHRPLAFVAVFGYLSWCLITTQGRFILPVLPLVALFLANATMTPEAPRAVRGFSLACVLATSVVNLAAASHQNLISGRWPFLSTGQSQDKLLDTENDSYPTPAHAAVEYINRQLPQSATILFVGDARSFYCDRRVIAPSVYDANPLWTATLAAKDAEEIKDRLKAMGVTHILLNGRGLYMGSPRAVLPAEAVRAPRFEDFWMHYLKPVFEDTDSSKGPARWLFVYELQDQRSPIMLQTYNIPASVLDSISR